MFISTNFLVTNYGVDEEIARFFVDRVPPADNLYWKGKLLYLRPSPGYLFIPLIVDLLYKTGVSRRQLLAENFVSTMEMTGHISALEESGQITRGEEIKKCAGLVTDTCTNKTWLTNLTHYFNSSGPNFFSPLITPFKALHRGDVFLFCVCALQFPGELNETIARHWFALISTLLLLDDGDDIDDDRETGDANAFLESGLTAEGVEKISELVKKNTGQIAEVNPTLANELEEQYKDLLESRISHHLVKK